MFTVTQMSQVSEARGRGQTALICSWLGVSGEQRRLRTSHVLEGQRGGGVAPGVTLLVAHPRLVQVLHEAVLVRAEEKQRALPS